MGREVRMVPANWSHPKNERGNYQPMHNLDYESALAEYNAEKEKWESGIFPDYADEEDRKLSYEEWDGSPPNPDYYMPPFRVEQRTHYMMYETTTEGTPISPAFATPQELARWLVENNASAFGDMTATYEQWLATINRGWAVSAVMDGKGNMESGVEAFYKDEQK